MKGNKTKNQDNCLYPETHSEFNTIVQNAIYNSLTIKTTIKFGILQENIPTQYFPFLPAKIFCRAISKKLIPDNTKYTWVGVHNFFKSLIGFIIF